MNERKPAVQQLLDSVHAGFAVAKAGAATTRCLDGVYARLAGSVGRAGSPSVPPPVCSHFPEAFRRAGTHSPELAAIAEALQSLKPALSWHGRKGGPFASENFDDGHVNATVVGPEGVEVRDDVRVGMTLMAPGVRYPDHNHPPEEIYLLLSTGEFRQGDGEWFEPGPGGTLHNVPHIKHAMRSLDAPLLAIWCLLPDRP